MTECLEGLEGIAVVADDILVYGNGNTDQEARINHDENLENLLKRCRQTDLKINEQKMRLHQTELIYIGHKITKDGIKPDESKVKAIQ